MNKYKIIGGMSAEEKDRISEALRRTANQEEAKKILADAGVEVTDEEILNFLERGKAELSDDELTEISGGSWYPKQYSQTPGEVSFVADIGQIVEVGTGWFGTTVRCTVTDTRVSRFLSAGTRDPGFLQFYTDEYYVVPLEDHWYFSARWVSGDRIEKPA